MNWEEVTIKKYNEVISLDCPTEFEEQLRGIGILKGLTYEQVRNLNGKQLTEYAKDISELGLKDIPNKPLKKWRDYKIGFNIKYMTAGQMMDYDTIRSEGDDIANLHKYMAILTNPQGLKEFEDRAELFYNEMPIGVAYGCHVFFCKPEKNSVWRLVRYLKEKAEKKGKRTNLLHIGAGLPSLMFLWGII